jgi:hypothetical protein
MICYSLTLLADKLEFFINLMSGGIKKDELSLHT